MFRIKIECEDQDVGAVLRLLSDLATHIEVPECVPSAKVGWPVVVPKLGERKSNSLPSLLMNAIKTKEMKTVTRKEIRDLSVEMGFKPVSANSVTHLLMHRDKFLKATGTRGVYEVRH